MQKAGIDWIRCNRYDDLRLCTGMQIVLSKGSVGMRLIMEETKKKAATRAAAKKTTSVKEAAKDTVKKAEEAAAPVVKAVKETAAPAAKAVKEAAAPAAKAVKEAAAPAAAKAKRAVKAEAGKVKTAAKKTAKAAEKKVAPKKIEATVSVQFSGKSYTTEELVAIAKDVWKYDLKQKAADFKSVELYVKPEENQAYYVINGEYSGSFFI